jgi:aspartyl-tRNA(Asn)/glutamyl-tRNA(Gln) amidotransferase subunit A
MTQLHSLSVSEMISGLRRKDFSAVELVQEHLDRINQTNESYNSVLRVDKDAALAQARGADARIADGKDSLPPLTGIPVLVKDQIVTESMETTCASKILQGFIPPYDSTAVHKLRQAGAIILGKTNQDEFAMGSSSENSAFGPVRNPWDTERVAGGSSGGSAVAVAVGQAPLALGTDTGGSIRQPASFTGVVGLKPTYGRVSRYGAVAYASSLDQIGPLGRTVLDVAQSLQAISGLDSKDGTSMDVAVPDYVSEIEKRSDHSLEGLRVGVPKEYFVDGMSEEVSQATKESLAKLEKLGATLVDISLPHTSYAIATYYIIAAAEASSNLARYDGVRYGYRAKNVASLSELYEKTRAEGFGAEVKRRILMGTYVLSAGYYDAYYRKAQQVRTLIIDDFKAAFTNHCDVIATPVSPTTAFKLGEKTDSPLAMYLADIFTITVNLSGIPGISLPCSKDTQGMPIGLQLLGKPFDESMLFRVASAFESVSEFDTFALARA